MWPPADVVATIAALDRPEVSGLRWTTEDQWHVTLRFLGDADVDHVRAAFDGIDAGRTTAVLGPATARFGRATLHAPVAGLDAIAAALPWPDERPFRGHLTLARARGKRGIDLRPVCGVPVAGEWAVDDITLVASELHPRGARYEVIARRPLR